jgi:hypothetical protein
VQKNAPDIDEGASLTMLKLHGDELVTLELGCNGRGGDADGITAADFG